MKNEKLKQFLQNYGFYLSVAAISIGAILAVFMMPEDGVSL